MAALDHGKSTMVARTRGAVSSRSPPPRPWLALRSRCTQMWQQQPGRGHGFQPQSLRHVHSSISRETLKRFMPRLTHSSISRETLKRFMPPLTHSSISQVYLHLRLRGDTQLLALSRSTYTLKSVDSSLLSFFSCLICRRNTLCSFIFASICSVLSFFSGHVQCFRHLLP